MGKSFTGLYRATNAGVVKCRVDIAAADIFLEALSGHMADGETIYTRLTDHGRAVFTEIQNKHGIRFSEYPNIYRYFYLYLQSDFALIC